jgi:MraZ protein
VSFTGEFRRSIDEKGRLIVPSRLRDELADGKVILTVWTEQCVSLWSGAGWERLESNLLAQRTNSTEARRFVRRMASKSHTDQVDKQGRITVPQHLREYAGIDKEVVLAGSLDHAEIWSPEGWAEEQRKQEETPMDVAIQDLNF